MKGILFDLDGTLIDSMGVWSNLDASFVESRGHEFKEEYIDELKSKSIVELPEFFHRVYGIDADLEEIRSFMAETMVDHYKNNFEYKDGVEDKLRQIKDGGFKMCITTATISEFCEEASERLGLYDYMEFIQTPDRAGVEKSDPEYFQIAIDKLGTEPEQTYVFDDALYALEIADSFGMVTVGVYDQSSELERDQIKEISDLYISSFLELDVGKL